MSEELPTITDLRDALSEIIDQGLGDHPAQIIVVPDSTLQAIARYCSSEACHKPVLMIELVRYKGRMPVALISTERLSDERYQIKKH